MITGGLRFTGNSLRMLSLSEALQNNLWVKSAQKTFPLPTAPFFVRAVGRGNVFLNLEN